MIQSMLTKESPEIIRFFRNIESLSEILDTQAEKMRPVLNGERYMTDSELAEHLKLTRRTLAEYRITGKLPYYKVGGKLLYKEKDILVLLERNRMEAFDYRCSCLWPLVSYSYFLPAKGTFCPRLRKAVLWTG